MKKKIEKLGLPTQEHLRYAGFDIHHYETEAATMMNNILLISQKLNEVIDYLNDRRTS